MSLAAVAQEAGTTRQALYRRWPDKASLAAAAVLADADTVLAAVSVLAGAPDAQGAAFPDPLADLTAELADFQRGVSQPGRLSLVGTMLQDGTAPELLARYRARFIAPRRGRLTAILEQARELGFIDADADVEVAVTLCTGSWYARALAGQPLPGNWPARTAALVWRSVGGGRPEQSLIHHVMSRRRVVRAAASAPARAMAARRAVPAANGSGAAVAAASRAGPKPAEPSGVPASAVAAV